MKTFTVYNLATGEPARKISCSLDMIDLNTGQDEGFIEGAFDRDAFYIASGSAVAKQSPPSAAHRWDSTTKQWVDPRTLQDFMASKWAAIKAAREASIDANLATPYGTFDCKAKDRSNITDAVLMLQTLSALGTPTTIDFTLTDNSTVTLTTAQMVTVGLLLGQKVQTAHGTARALRAQIEAATTSNQVEAITWPAI